jgi:tRNA 2-thiouridine synthesizing protein E
MQEISVGGKTVTLDDENYLVDSGQWDLEVAKAIANKLGYDELDEEQLEIIRFLRDYYNKFNAFPILNYVCMHTDQPKRCMNREFINPMNAWKIAGLPKLDGVHFVSVDGKHYQMEDFPG